MKTNKSLIKKALLIAVLAALLLVAAMLTVKISVYAKRDNSELDYTFERVPVESIDICADGDITEIQPRQSFMVSFEVTPWYTTTSKIYFDVFPQSAATVTEVTEVNLSNGKAQGKAEIYVTEDAVVGSTFKITAGADNVESNEVELTVAKIPVTGLNLSLLGTDDKLHIGKTRTVEYDFSPSFATVQDVRYELYGNGLKYIESFDERTGTIKAKDGIAALDVNSTVTIIAYSVDNPNAFDSVTVSLYMPTTIVEISATTPLGRITSDNNPLAVANSKKGDTVTLHTTVNGVDSSGLNYVIVKGQEYIENGIVHSDGTFKLRPTTGWSEAMKIPHPEIKIRAAYSDGYDEIVVGVYIPVEKISFVNSAPTEVENYRSYNLEAEAFPKYATQLADNSIPISYSLGELDSSIAVINSEGILNLPKSLTSKGSVINYSASLVNAWDGVDVAPLTRNITVVPVYATSFKAISILKDGVSIFDNDVKVLPSDKLQVNVDYTIDNVTDVDFSLSESSNMLSTDDNIIEVAAIDLMENDNPYIKIVIAYDNGGISFNETRAISIYVPALSAKIDDAVFMRDRSLNLKTLITINGHGFASNKTIEWGVPTISNSKVGISAVCEDGILKIDTQANAGSLVKVPYRTFDSNDWQYKEFTVAPLFGSFTLEYGKISNNEDLREYEVNYEAPQLEEGQSVDLYLKFNGVGVSDQFGVSYSVKVSNNANIYYCGGDGQKDIFRLSAKSGQSGRNNNIRYAITVKDGTSTYYVFTDNIGVSANSWIDLNTKEIAIFKRISGNIDIFNTRINEQESFILTGWSNSITFNSADLVWQISGGKMEGRKIVSAPNRGFILSVTAKQQYNSAEIAYTFEAQFHSVIYYNDDTFVKKTYVRQYYGIQLEGRICTKEYNVQSGWSSEDDGSFNLNSIYYGYFDLVLYAEWSPLREVIEKPGEVKITDDGVYSYSDKISPLFDIALLRSLGYTEISITIVFNCKEINDGYQDVRIFSGSDSNRIGDATVEHGKGHKDTSWWKHTITYNVAFDKFTSNDASFYIGWGAHGGLGDNWSLGERTITIEAK